VFRTPSIIEILSIFRADYVYLPELYSADLTQNPSSFFFFEIRIEIPLLSFTLGKSGK